jgi:hypothetical protein
MVFGGLILAFMIIEGRDSARFLLHNKLESWHVAMDQTLEGNTQATGHCHFVRTTICPTWRRYKTFRIGYPTHGSLPAARW